MLEKGLKEILEIKEGESVMKRTEEWLCSENFETWAKSADSGFSLSIPLLEDVLPFDFDSSSEESWKKLRTLCKEKKLDFRRSTMKHIYSVRLGEGATQIMNQCFRAPPCGYTHGSIVDGDATSKKTQLLVDLRWIGTEDEVGKIERVSWSGDIKRCAIDGLLGQPLRRTGVVLSCTWATEAAGSGALIVGTSKGDWGEVVAQPGLERVGTLSVSYNEPDTEVVGAGNRCGVVTTPKLDHVKCRKKGGKILHGGLPVDVPIRAPAGMTPVCTHIKKRDFGWLELDITASLAADPGHWFTGTGKLSCIKGGGACAFTRPLSKNNERTNGEPAKLNRKLRCGSHSQVWEFCAPQSTRKGVLTPVSKTLELYPGGEVVFRASSTANLVAKVDGSHIEFPAGMDVPGVLAQVGSPVAVSGSPTDFYYKYRVVHGTKMERECPEPATATQASTPVNPPETKSPPGCSIGYTRRGGSSVFLLALLALGLGRRLRRMS